MTTARRSWLQYYGGALNPKTIFGAQLKAWYVASTASVSAWPDSSGTGDANKNLAQATGGLQPTIQASNALYNNQPTVTFGGTAPLMVSGTWASSLAIPFTVILVGHDATSGNHYFFDGQTAGQLSIFDASGNMTMFDSASLASVVTAVATPSITTCVFNNTTSSIAVRQNTPQTSGTDGGTTPLVQVTMGNFHGGANACNGPIAEVIVISGVITSPQRIAACTNYLAKKYGLTQGA